MGAKFRKIINDLTNSIIYLFVCNYISLNLIIELNYNLYKLSN